VRPRGKRHKPFRPAARQPVGAAAAQFEHRRRHERAVHLGHRGSVRRPRGAHDHTDQGGAGNGSRQIRSVPGGSQQCDERGDPRQLAVGERRPPPARHDLLAAGQRDRRPVPSYLQAHRTHLARRGLRRLRGPAHRVGVQHHPQGLVCRAVAGKGIGGRAEHRGLGVHQIADGGGNDAQTPGALRLHQPHQLAVTQRGWSAQHQLVDDVGRIIERVRSIRYGQHRHPEQVAPVLPEARGQPRQRARPVSQPGAYPPRPTRLRELVPCHGPHPAARLLPRHQPHVSAE